MDKLISSLLSRQGRIWLYSLGIATIALLTSYGILNGEHAAAWTAILAPLFGVAIANVPPKE